MTIASCCAARPAFSLLLVATSASIIMARTRCHRATPTTRISCTSLLIKRHNGPKELQAIAMRTECHPHQPLAHGIDARARIVAEKVGTGRIPSVLAVKVVTRFSPVVLIVTAVAPQTLRHGKSAGPEAALGVGPIDALRPEGRLAAQKSPILERRQDSR